MGAYTSSLVGHLIIDENGRELSSAIADQLTRLREMKAVDPNKIHFKLWRLLEFEVIGRDAIHAGKPYMVFGAAFLVLFSVFLYSTQFIGIDRFISLLAR